MQRTRQSSYGRSRFSSYSKRPNRFGARSSYGHRPRFGRSGISIDINKFIQAAAPQNAQETYRSQNNFADFSFNGALQANLTKRSYATPTAIQDQAIKPIAEGKDVVGLANTGTGKTAAFLLPLIDRVFRDRQKNRVLIIAPTRELALQINHEFLTFAGGMSLYSAACVGGAPIGWQIRDLNRASQFVIGTPGRLKDLEQRGTLRLDAFNHIVLDEVDRMLDMGFIDDITHLLGKMPEDKQSLFFSATMPTKIRDLVGKFMKDPMTIEVSCSKTAPNVTQDVVRVYDRQKKFHQLCDILNRSEASKTLIFSETKRSVEDLETELTKSGYRAASIHGNKRQSQRQRALLAFRKNNANILVATDVAARGLDIDNISHVINYTTPRTYDDYIHRIGRTGRGSKGGIALTFVESR